MTSVIVDKLSQDSLAFKNKCLIFTDRNLGASSIRINGKNYSVEINHLNSMKDYVPSHESTKLALTKIQLSFILQVPMLIRREHGLELGKEIKITFAEIPLQLKDVLYEVVFDGKEIDLSQFDIDGLLLTALNGTIVNENTMVPLDLPGQNPLKIKIIKCDKSFGLISNETVFHSFNTKKALKIDKISFETLDVGGLSEQFEEIFTKVFLSRVVPTSLHRQLGVKHVKGIIMYGPPGCGKTRMARSMSQILNCKNIKIVNGPELLDKYVGGSEEKVRALFAGAEAKPNELHVIIFDEFDSLARTRGSGGSAGSHAGDNVVTQLLSKIDGVESLDNIILFGLTNRLDIVDEAILRPGRFEVHIRVGLPNETGRKEIFKIHMKDIIASKSLSPEVNIDELASLTENFTGAELEAVVKNAVSMSMRSQIDMNNITESANKIKKVLVSKENFITAIMTSKPMFGMAQNVIETLKSKIFIEDHPMAEMVFELISKSKKSTIIGLRGSPKSGKSSIACSVALKLMDERKGIYNPDGSMGHIPYVRYLNANTFLNKGVTEKTSILLRTLTDGTNGLVILDNIESILEFVPPNKFDNNIFQLLKTIFYETKNHVIICSVRKEILEELSFFESVDAWIEIP